ncbi:prolipoprotein diacylglyceryl transferase family protein [Paenibacillus cineris]|uniref:prolipoprotein diacylglyceryl transferase family protein n=1 Tax=Paenibacillus cineris TaxID=237530 RepID=UPI0024581129|nr:prolipoprotein diacylglyceryl transferase family protein [Paenibacillus cineris]
MESVFNFGLCVILLLIAKKKKKVGLVACVYLILYSLGRFLIEFYRGDIIRGQVGLLSTSQLIALLVVVLTSFIVFLSQYRNRLMGSKGL